MKQLQRLVSQCDPIRAMKVWWPSSGEKNILYVKKNVKGEELKAYNQNKKLVVECI